MLQESKNLKFKTMKLKIISICLFFVAVFLSCKKEDFLIDSNTSVSNLLSQVKTDNQPSIAYSYNVSNIVSEEKSKYDFTSYRYNDKNLLVTADYYTNYNILSSDLQVVETCLNMKDWFTADNANKGGSINYEYNDKQQLVKSVYSTPSGSYQFSEFSYGTNDRITRQLLYWEDTKTGYIDYSFDDKGNLIEENLYYLSTAGVAELITTTRYEFDNQQNPYKSVSRLMTPGINTNINNITKETCTIHLNASQGADKVEVTENSYKYNSSGFPISKNGNIEYIYG